MKVKDFDFILSDMEKNDIKLFKHSERVAMLCYEFCKKFDFDGSDRETLFFAGLLHEIGRFSLRNFTEEQQKLLNIDEYYPIVSCAMINMADGFGRIAKIVGQHLENIDGSGVPLHLSVDDIHLCATMLHICDFYDHCRMNGDSHSAAASKLRKQTDIMFPKKIITPFIKMLIT